jgi:hypothetical protein
MIKLAKACSKNTTENSQPLAKDNPLSFISPILEKDLNNNESLNVELLSKCVDYLSHDKLQEVI